jgi:hypothetical protein
MQSPSSLRLGIVRSHHATELRALRPSPLALAAGESMKIEGASRRSAAPGSQTVGAAEYSGDLARSSSRGALGATSESLDPSQPFESPRPFRPSSRLALPRTIGVSTACVCAIPCPVNRHRAWQSRQQPQNTHFLSAAMPSTSRTAANPSFNLTRSGLRPPRAS